MLKSASFTKVVPAICDYGILKLLVTELASQGKTVRINICVLIRMNLIVFLFIINLMTHHFKLLSFHFSFELLVELPTTFVVTTVVNKDATVSEITPPCLIKVLAALWIVVHTSGITDESRCSDGT